MSLVRSKKDGLVILAICACVCVFIATWYMVPTLRGQFVRGSIRRPAFGGYPCDSDPTTIVPEFLQQLVLPDSHDICHSYGVSGEKILVYIVDDAYPGEETLSSIYDRLIAAGYTPQRMDRDDPRIPSSIVRGWTKRGSEFDNDIHHRWKASFNHADGSVISVYFSYDEVPSYTAAGGHLHKLGVSIDFIAHSSSAGD